MTVHRLSLSGLTDDEADQAVQALFVHPRLERVLVDDDVELLAKHEAAYQRLITSNRVHTLLCVAVGARAESDGRLWLPEYLGHVQGYGVLWIGDRQASTGGRPRSRSPTFMRVPPMAWTSLSTCSMRTRYSTACTRPSTRAFRAGSPVRGCA